MGLFDKKYCDVCGEKIGLLGNRKLEDGNLCKSCASKLSPWFSERRKSTVEEIKEQLAYREENQEKVAAFHATRTLGSDTKVILDEMCDPYREMPSGMKGEVLYIDDAGGAHIAWSNGSTLAAIHGVDRFHRDPDQ